VANIVKAVQNIWSSNNRPLLEIRQCASWRTVVAKYNCWITVSQSLHKLKQSTSDWNKSYFIIFCLL